MCVSLQNGAALKLSQEDQKALRMGMVLHEHGRAAMAASDFPRALELLELSEQTFALVRLDAVGAIDNVALMLIDLVWCAQRPCRHCNEFCLFHDNLKVLSSSEH